MVATQTEPSRASTLEHWHIVQKDVETSENAIIDLATPCENGFREIEVSVVSREQHSPRFQRLCPGV